MEGLKKTSQKWAFDPNPFLNFFYCFNPITGGIWYHPPEIIEGVQLNVNLIVGLKFWAHLRRIGIRETFGTHSRHIRKTFRTHSRHIRKTFMKHSDKILDTFGTHLEDIWLDYCLNIWNLNVYLIIDLTLDLKIYYRFVLTLNLRFSLTIFW